MQAPREQHSQDPYVYKQLNTCDREFRLLQFLPSGEFFSPIQCELFHSTLSNHLLTRHYLTSGATPTTLLQSSFTPNVKLAISLSSLELHPCLWFSEDSYLIVGGCCLVDSELEGLGDGFGDLAQDPGVSLIMQGSAWDESKLKDFYIDWMVLKQTHLLWEF